LFEPLSKLDAAPRLLLAEINQCPHGPAHTRGVKPDNFTRVVARYWVVTLAVWVQLKLAGGASHPVEPPAPFASPPHSGP